MDYDIIDKSTGASRGSGSNKNKFNHTIPAVKYDVVLHKDNLHFNLTLDLNTNLTGVVIIDDLSTFLSSISIPYFTPRLGYGINVSIPIDNATLAISYSGITINENIIRVYKCDDWSVSTRTCTGTWSRIPISVDKNNDLIRFSVSSFSGLVGGESSVFTVNASGIALDYYTGHRISGNITAIPVENPENKYTTSVTNGEWSMGFDMLSEGIEHLMFVVESTEKKGYNYLKLPTPSTAKLNCTIQNISLSGYSVDVSGIGITSGNVRISVLGTDYTNTTSFSGGTWSIDFHPCLIPGQVYTLQILISDNRGKRGEILQKYPAK
ncbi:MAG: hypothetical protein QMD36_06655 [Candidatus Aenigmarchaeota archaeon]|nr:hypothetical protein [Candidatus Aenigmarchaeota archaeon]